MRSVPFDETGHGSYHHTVPDCPCVRDEHGGSPAREPPHPSIGLGGLEPCAERSNRLGILYSWDPGCGVGGASRRRWWARLGL